MGIAGWNPKVKYPGAREYFDAHVKKHQKEPDRWASAFAYASLQILEQCVGEVGLDRRARSRRCSTPPSSDGGRARSSSSRARTSPRPGMVGQWQKGEFEMVWPKSLGHRQRRWCRSRPGRDAACSPTLLLGHRGRRAPTGGIYALVALGLNLQYGLMRVLNVAHGEFLMLGAYLTYSLHTGMGRQPAADLADHGPGGLRRRPRAAPPPLRPRCSTGDAPEALESRSLLISFGLLFVLQNGALLIWSADLRGYSYLAVPLRGLGTVFPANRVVAAGVALGPGPRVLRLPARRPSPGRPCAP